MTDTVEKILAHHGIKGMHWGVTTKSNASSGPSEAVATQKAPGKKITTTGGSGQKASTEALNAAKTRQQAKASSISSLSNKELQDAVNRMNLERQFAQTVAATNPSAVAKGQRFVKSLLGLGRTANEVVSFQNSPAGKQLSNKLKKN